MVIYGITLVPLVEDLQAVDPGILTPFYTEDTVFDGLVRCSTQLLNIILERVPKRGYFPNTAKLRFIAESPGQEEAVKWEFEAKGTHLNFVGGIRYLRAYLGTREDLEAWVPPQVEAWDHGVRTLGKIVKRQPQSVYEGLGVSLHLE